MRFQWLTSYVEPERLLEVGCSGGFFLDAARRSGTAVVGVEPEANVAKRGERELGVEIRIGRFEDTEIDAACDVVCGFHVLEHVEDPLAFVERARALVVPEGHLALEVPNIESRGAARERAAWPGLQPEFHRWHFTPRTLSRLVTSAGFDVIALDTVFPHHYARKSQPRRYLETWLRDIRVSRTLRSVHAVGGDYVRLVGKASGASTAFEGHVSTPQ